MRKIINTPTTYIYFLFSVGIAVQIFSLILFGGNFLEKIVFDFSYFVDFFDHVRRFYLGLNNVYAEGMHACFPPLAYCMYYIISRILYKDNISKPETINTSGSGMLLICMLTAIFMMFFIFAFFRLYHGKSIASKKWMAALFMCSYPFWLAIERGNMSLFVLILLMYAMALKDSTKSWEREVALLLFAVAAALKLYPAVFGLLYLFSKRYKEAARLIIYGVLFFFLPFVFFQGMLGFQIFLHNLNAVGSGATGVTIVGICGRVGLKLGMSLERGHAIGRIISYLYFGIAIIYSCYRKDTWRTVMFLSSLMIIFVAASGTYCLIYCTIPFICYMNELKEIQNYTKMHYVYATLFVLIFSAYPIKALGSSGALYIAFYLLIAVLLIEATVHGIRRIKFRFLNNKMLSGG